MDQATRRVRLWIILVMSSILLPLTPTADPIRAQTTPVGTIAVVQQGNIYLLELPTGNTTQLTDDGLVNESDEASYADLAWSPDATRILFAANFSGNYDLYSMSIDGADVQRLTDTPESEHFPILTPDGVLIFTRQYPDPVVDAPSSGPPTEIIARNPGGLETILYQRTGVATSLSLSNDGQVVASFRICCAGSGEALIFSGRTPGGPVESVASRFACSTEVYEAAWYGQQLAVLASSFCEGADMPSGGVYLIDMEGNSAPQPLYLPDLAFLFGLAWSADGQWLSVGVHGTDASPSMLYLIDATTGEQQPVANGAILSEDAAWRPETRIVASPVPATTAPSPTIPPSPTSAATQTALPTSPPTATATTPTPAESFFSLCVGPGECGVAPSRGGPARIVVTNVTLLDSLGSGDFPATEVTQQLKNNKLWIQVSNDGTAASSSTSYEVVVTLKQGTTILEQQLFKSTQDIPDLTPGAITNTSVNNVFFFHVVTAGQLEVELIPTPGGKAAPASWLGVKPISINRHPDTICECVIDVASGLVSALAPGGSLALQTARPGVRGLITSFNYAGLGLSIVKATCTGDIRAWLKDAATWLVGELLGAYNKAAAEIVMPSLDATRTIIEESIPCLKLKDWLVALTNAWLFHTVDIHMVWIESPAYPLITNAAGQRAGFLPDGTQVTEFPGAYVLLLGEKRLVAYENKPVKVQITGYDNGTMDVYASVGNTPETSTLVVYSQVPVHPGLQASIDLQQSSPALAIDANADGIVEEQMSISEQIPIEGTSNQGTPQPAPSDKPADTRSSLPWMILGGVLGAGALLGVGIMLGRRSTRR